MIIIGGLANKYDLTNLLLKNMFKLNFIYGKAWGFSICFVLLTYFIATLVNPYIVILFIFQIIADLCRKLELNPMSSWPIMMVVACTMACSLSIINLPFKSTVLLFLGILSNTTSQTVNWGNYIIYAQTIIILSLLLFLLACKLIFRPDVSVLKQIDTSYFGENQKMSKEQKYALIFLAAFIFLMLVDVIFPADFFFTQIMLKIGLTNRIALLLIIGALIRVNGKPFIDFNTFANIGMQWNVFLVMSFALPVMTLLSSAEIGLSTSLAMLLTPILGGKSGIVFILIFLTVSVLLTNILNNMAVIMIMIPIMLGFMQTANINSTSLTICLIIIGYAAILTPAASPLTAIMYGNKNQINMKYGIIYGLVFIAIMIIVMLIVCIPLGAVLFK